jgi:hypothetical protein
MLIRSILLDRVSILPQKKGEYQSFLLSVSFLPRRNPGEIEPDRRGLSWIGIELERIQDKTDF